MVACPVVSVVLLSSVWSAPATSNPTGRFAIGSPNESVAYAVKLWLPPTGRGFTVAGDKTSEPAGRPKVGVQVMVIGTESKADSPCGVASAITVSLPAAVPAYWNAATPLALLVPSSSPGLAPDILRRTGTLAKGLPDPFWTVAIIDTG